MERKVPEKSVPGWDVAPARPGGEFRVVAQNGTPVVSPSLLMFTRGCQRVSVFWARFPEKQSCNSRVHGGDVGQRPERAQPRARACGLVPVRLLRGNGLGGQSARCHKRSFSSSSATSFLSPANDSPVSPLNQGGPCGSPQPAPVQVLRKQVLPGSSQVSVSCAWRGEGRAPWAR